MFGVKFEWSSFWRYWCMGAGKVAEMKTILRLCLVTSVLALVGSTAYGQQVNPHKLPPCPKNQSARFHNCWGTVTHSDGDKYVGEFKDGTSNGQGTYTFANGDKYVGEFKDGTFNTSPLKVGSNSTLYRPQHLVHFATLS